MSLYQTAERVSQYQDSDNYVFQRSIFAYHEAAKLVKGKVLELGTGMGYGVEIISTACEEYVTLDKFKPGIDISTYKNVRFDQQTFPPFQRMESDYFDFVITFQVIEHIEDDHAFVKEIARVLKPGGKAIITTPNKKMSLTRNPWHVREYNQQEFSDILSKYFNVVDRKGVKGNDKIMNYYEKNRESVKKLTRWDIFNLQYNLPSWMLRIPFDIANRWNRRKLLNENTDLTQSITIADYETVPFEEICIDLFYIATK